jgi:hypothetical protein
MDPHRSKAVGFFNTQGTTAVLLAAKNPNWKPVIETVWSSSDSAAELNIFIGGTCASLTINQTGSNNTIVFRAWRKGDSGENITVEIVKNGTNTPLSVDTTVNDHSITDVDVVINLATNGGGDAISTAAEVIAAVNADPTASKYLYAEPSGDVSGVMTESTAQAPLAGATPDEDAGLVFADAYVFAGILPPGGIEGNAGDDVRVAVSAGTDDIFLSGYWIAGEDLGYGPPTNPSGAFEPNGRPVGVSAYA